MLRSQSRAFLAKLPVETEPTFLNLDFLLFLLPVLFSNLLSTLILVVGVVVNCSQIQASLCNGCGVVCRCDLCGGKVKLTESGGRRWLAEAIGNYTTNMKCTWYVEADSPNATIRLHLKEFATECGWDHLYIWDGDSIFEGLQAVYSGLVRLDRYSTSRVPEVVGTSGSMLLHFYSDVAYNMTGFNITFSMDSCPSEYSATTCSGHGICEGGVCSCDTDYRGAACQIPACPHNCGRNGKCNEEGKYCECAPGWKGDDCSQKAETGYWEVAAAGGSGDGSAGIEERRTSHQAVVDRGYMWAVGGEQLHRQAGRGMLRRWELARAAWQPVEVDSGRAPSERYGHSAVVHDSKIYMYGGVMRSGHVSKVNFAAVFKM